MTNIKQRHLQTFWLPLILTLAIAFALRVNAIDRQSVWYDEGLSIHYARGNAGDILRSVSESDHPPLHPLLLHFWMDLCGDSELAVRSFSVWWGMLGTGSIAFGRIVQAVKGKWIVNVLPVPGTGLSTDTRPPCSSTIARVMARPRPVPPVSRVRAPSVL